MAFQVTPGMEGKEDAETAVPKNIAMLEMPLEIEPNLMNKLWLTVLMVFVALMARAEVSVPAFTAYLEPQMDGGFVPGFTKFGVKFTRPAVGVAPEDCHTFIKPKH
jgi:hypothetical protein